MAPKAAEGLQSLVTKPLSWTLSDPKGGALPLTQIQPESLSPGES